MAIFAGSINLFTKGKLKLGDGVFSLSSTPIKLMLLTSTYAPDQNVDEFVADIVANEVSGNGYARQSLTTTWQQNGNLCEFVTDDPTFTASGGDIVFRYWVMFADLGDDALNPLIAYGFADATPADRTILDGFSEVGNFPARLFTF